MQEEKKQCTEIARVSLPWGGKILNYCPVHANKIAAVAEAMGAPIKAQLLANTNIQCGSLDEITEDEKKLNNAFPSQ